MTVKMFENYKYGEWREGWGTLRACRTGDEMVCVGRTRERIGGGCHRL